VSDEMKEHKPMTSAMWCEKWERENDRANSLQAKVEELEAVVDENRKDFSRINGILETKYDTDLHGIGVNALSRAAIRI